jgi:hypothetical protein
MTLRSKPGKTQWNDFGMLDHPSVGDLYRKESVFFFKKEKIKKNKLSMETRFHLLEKC